MGALFLKSIDNLDVVFSALLNRSLAAALLILTACLYRVLLPKAPKWSRLLLWALAAVRLALPVPIRSVWSLVPSETVLDYETAQYAAKPEITSGIAAVNRVVNPAFGERFAANPAASVNPLQVWMHIAGGIWALGVLVLLVLALVSFLKVRRRVGASIECWPGVRLCDGIDTPFLLGIFRPTIYLPSGLPEDEREYVLAHEIAHKTHGDCVWKLLGYGLLCVYWFNPLVWLGYSLFCRDLELACDERVVKGYSLSEKKRYASVLLSNSVPRGAISVCPLAFGEVGVKERVKRVLDKRPTKVLIALALVLCLVIGVLFATSPEKTIYDFGISSGSYVMDESEDFPIAPPRVTFRMMEGGKYEFVFTLSVLSSYHMTGEFTIKNGKVTCDDGTYRLVFIPKDYDTIILQIPGQDGLHMNGKFIPNGTEFFYEEPSRARITYSEVPTSGEETRADFSLDFGEAIDYGDVWAELWQDGACIKSRILALTAADSELHLSFTRDDDLQGNPGVQVRMQTDLSGGWITGFPLPKGLENFRYISYTDGETLFPTDSSEYVLAALTLGFGEFDEDEIELIDLTMLPGLYTTQSPCTLVVKAAFGSNELPRVSDFDGEIDLSDGKMIRAAVSPQTETPQLLVSHLVTNSKQLSVSCADIPENAEVLLSLYNEDENYRTHTAILTAEEPSATFTGLTSVKHYKFYAVLKHCEETLVFKLWG